MSEQKSDTMEQWGNRWAQRCVHNGQSVGFIPAQEFLDFARPHDAEDAVKNSLLRRYATEHHNDWHDGGTLEGCPMTTCKTVCEVIRE